MTTTTAPFGPEELRARSRDAYVGNETDTDQYGETQPSAGVGVAAAIMTLLPEFTNEADLAWTEIQAWVAAADDPHNYDGADEAATMYARYHDLMWDRGEHPYYNDLAELKEMLDDDDGSVEANP